MKPEILITGASGFVGQSLMNIPGMHGRITALSRNYTKNVNTNYETITWNELSGFTKSFNAVIHLAGLAHDTRSEKSEQEYLQVNAGLTQKLVQWINTTQHQSVSFIYLSSVKVYGHHKGLITEETPAIPDSVYGKSKLTAENIIRNELLPLHRAYILQPVLIYGKGQKGNLHLLEQWIDRHLPNIFTASSNARSLLYIENLHFVIEQIVNRNILPGTFLISNDDPLSTGQLLQMLGEAKQKPPVKIAVPLKLLKAIAFFKPGLGDKLLGDLQVSNQKIKNALGIAQMPYTNQQGFSRMML